MARKSGFFRKICTGTAWKEREGNTVTLQNDDPIAFARLLQFLYHGAYTYDLRRTVSYGKPQRPVTALYDLTSSGEDSTYFDKYDVDSRNFADYDIEVYDLANKYDVPTLKVFSLRECVENVTSESYEAAELRTLFAEHYLARASHDQDLKNALAKCIAWNFDDIRGDEYEWEEGIGKWIKEDFELSTMVMEQLSCQGKKESEDSEVGEI